MNIINNKNKHIVFYSGGLGSFSTALRVIEKHGSENLTLLFTDTLIEDYDLYRFIIETAGYFFGVDKHKISSLSDRAVNLTNTEDNMDKRKFELEQLRLDTNELIPQMVWLSDKVDPWTSSLNKNS